MSNFSSINILTLGYINGLSIIHHLSAFLALENGNIIPQRKCKHVISSLLNIFYAGGPDVGKSSADKLRTSGIADPVTHAAVTMQGYFTCKQT